MTSFRGLNTLIMANLALIMQMSLKSWLIGWKKLVSFVARSPNIFGTKGKHRRYRHRADIFASWATMIALTLVLLPDY